MASSTATFRLKNHVDKIEEGWMEKKGHLMPNWKKRFFSFDKNKLVLTYYSDENKRNFRSSYNVTQNSYVEVIEQGLDRKTYVIKLDGKTNGKDSTLYMSTSSIEERERWFEIFAEIIWGVKVNQPKLCDVFRNQVPLEILYGTTLADDGCILLPELTKERPIIDYYVPPQGSGYYCIIMVNPDPPSFAESQNRRKSVFGMTNLRNYAHWVVCNIPGNDVSAGSCIVEYLPACPVYNTGLQRHFFLLFKQGEKFLSPEEVVEAEAYFEKRGGLQVCNWAQEQGFGLPVGVNGFQAKWSAFCDEVHRSMDFLPPSEYRSPGQIGWLERVSLEKKLHETEVAAEERAKQEEAARRKAAEEARLYEPGTDISILLAGFNITSKEVFDGIWVKKKFSNNYSMKNRFIWIDASDGRFFWSKTKGKDNEAKSLGITQDVYTACVAEDNSSFEVTFNDGTSLKVVFVESSKLQLAQDFVAVFEKLISVR